MAHNVGEKPGKGRCCCTKCSWSVVLDDDDDQLPPYAIAARGNARLIHDAEGGGPVKRRVAC